MTNEYQTPYLKLTKPQPGTKNYGATMNQNLETIDEGFKKLIESYNSAVERLESSTGYIAANEDYYLYCFIPGSTSSTDTGPFNLYKLPSNMDPPSGTSLAQYLVYNIDELTVGAYALMIRKGSVPYSNGVKLLCLGSTIWEDGDVVLIQTGWSSLSHQYVTAATKLPHLTGGYYVPDDNGYTLNGRVIKQTFNRKDAAAAMESIERKLPYVVYQPTEENASLGKIYFKEVVYLPNDDNTDNHHSTGNKIEFDFSPVSATSAITTITFNKTQYDKVGYCSTGISKIDSNDKAERTESNLQLQFFDNENDWNRILINYKLEVDTNGIFLIKNIGDLPDGTIIQILIISTTTASLEGLRTISNSDIDKLFEGA